MYRALSFSSLMIHPNAGQLLFAVMVAASFVGFITFEERQLIKNRGDEYREYYGENTVSDLPRHLVARLPLKFSC